LAEGTMLPKPHRLNRSKDISHVFQKGRSFFTKILGFKVVKNHLGVSRFGIITSIKVEKRATKRNKIKRRIREIIRLKLPDIKEGYDFLIIALPPIVDKNYQEISETIHQILQKLKLLNK